MNPPIDPSSTPSSSRTGVPPLPAPPAPLPSNANPGLILETLLKRPAQLVTALQQTGSGGLSTWLAVAALISLAAYGLVVGTFSGGDQLIAAPLKISVGALFSMLICLPSLFIFACLTGADVTLRATIGVPDVAAIAELSQQYGANGMMVFSTMTVEQSSSVHTRMFAPLIGIVEDPATGSASGALGAYLVQHGVVDIRPETEITAEQGYEIDRPSRILIQVNSDDDAIQGVMVGGESILVVEGTLSC